MTMRSISSSAESRNLPRRRTRLQPVKIVTEDRLFIEDGTAIDRSETGARVRRYTGGQLPPHLGLYDEIEHTFQAATLVWSRGQQIGLRFTGPAITADPAEILRLTGRYYAVTD